MAKAVEMSVDNYAKSIGRSRGTIYRWIYAKEKGEENKLPKGVSFKKLIGRYVMLVK